jgi:hypothetical protein
MATDENGTEPGLTKSHKLLKTSVPNELFYDFIKKISHKMPNSDCFLIDLFAYKKATYCAECPDAISTGTGTGTGTENYSPSQSLLQKFCEDLMPYYCKDKQFFLTRKMSYNNLNTILRQICRYNSIECRSERKYDKSKTHIVYYIHDDTK